MSVFTPPPSKTVTFIRKDKPKKRAVLDVVIGSNEFSLIECLQAVFHRPIGAWFDEFGNEVVLDMTELLDTYLILPSPRKVKTDRTEASSSSKFARFWKRLFSGGGGSGGNGGAINFDMEATQIRLIVFDAPSH